LTYRFNWHIAGTDGDGIRTVRNGEAFSVRFEASVTAVPPCEPQSGAWIQSGGQNFVPNSSSELFDWLRWRGRYYPTVNGQTGSYHSTDPHQIVTTTQFGVWNAERGDNFTTATLVGEQNTLAAGYQFVRIEGYVFPQP
jgi:hypothetical protein